MIAVAHVLLRGAGLFTPETITATLYGLPGALLGLVCSIPMARRVPEQQFRCVLLALIVLASLLYLYRNGKAFVYILDIFRHVIVTLNALHFIAHQIEADHNVGPQRIAQKLFIFVLQRINNNSVLLIE